MEVKDSIVEIGYTDMSKQLLRVAEGIVIFSVLFRGENLNYDRVLYSILKGWEKRLHEEILKIEEKEVMGVGNPRR